MPRCLTTHSGSRGLPSGRIGCRYSRISLLGTRRSGKKEPTPSRETETSDANLGIVELVIEPPHSRPKPSPQPFVPNIGLSERANQGRRSQTEPPVPAGSSARSFWLDDRRSPRLFWSRVGCDVLSKARSEPASAFHPRGGATIRSAPLRGLVISVCVRRSRAPHRRSRLRRRRRKQLPAGEVVQSSTEGWPAVRWFGSGVSVDVVCCFSESDGERTWALPGGDPAVRARPRGRE